MEALIISNVLFIGAVMFLIMDKITLNRRLKDSESRVELHKNKSEKLADLYEKEFKDSSRLRNVINELNSKVREYEGYFDFKDLNISKEIAVYRIYKSEQEERRKEKQAKELISNKKFKSDSDAYDYYRRNGGSDNFNTFLTLGLVYALSDDSNSSSQTSYDSGYHSSSYSSYDSNSSSSDSSSSSSDW